jgi:hypothetical protein
VQVQYDEGVALHIGPEPCVIVREDDGEASAGGHTGQPLSRDRKLSRAPTPYAARKATRTDAIVRAFGRPGVVVDPGMYGRSLRGNREISCLAENGQSLSVRTGKARSRSQ